MTGADRFDPVADKWLHVLGRLRDVVRRELVTAQLTEQLAGAGPARVLDIGCGQGTQALALARAGHTVTGLDPSADLLAVFATALATEPPVVRDRITTVHGPGERAADLVQPGFDVVLCHGVLMYVDDDLPLLRAATTVASPGALLSLLVRNGHALAMRPGLLRDWDDALAAFDAAGYVNRLGLSARAHRLEQLNDELAPLGWTAHAWFGVRVFTDHLDEPVDDVDLGHLLRAEAEAGRRDPYRRVAALLHCLYRLAEPGQSR